MKRNFRQDEIDGRVTGRFYFNPQDSRIFVRRRTGIGSWTMNMGNIRSWIISLALAAAAYGILRCIQG